MKHLGLLIGAAVLAIAAVASGLSTPAPAARERRVEVPVRIEEAVSKSEPVNRGREESRIVEGRGESEDRREVRSDAGLPPAQERMLGLFERDLALTAEQRRQMESILLERTSQIEEFNKEIRISGVFSASGYSGRVRAIQQASYERMDALLDGGQHRRFVALLTEGRLGDAVVFSVDPGMIRVE